MKTETGRERKDRLMDEALENARELRSKADLQQIPKPVSDNVLDQGNVARIVEWVIDKTGFSLFSEEIDEFLGMIKGLPKQSLNKQT